MSLLILIKKHLSSSDKANFYKKDTEINKELEPTKTDEANEANLDKKDTQINTELEPTKTVDPEPSELSNPIIRCSTPYHSITVTKNQDDSYTYTAYEK